MNKANANTGATLGNISLISDTVVCYPVIVET